MANDTGHEQRAAAGAPAGQQQAEPGTPGGRPADSTGHTPDRPATWHRVADLYPTLGADPKTVRRWIARHVPTDAQERREPAGGGSAELYLRDDQVAALRSAYPHRTAAGATPDRPAGAPAEHRAEAPDSSGQAPGAPGDPAAGWQQLVAELRAENDRLRSQIEAEKVKREEAVRRAEETELARHTAVEQLAGCRAAWWAWYALASTRGLWARLRGRMPEPPPELAASDRLLTG